MTETPILDALIDIVKQLRLPLHVPGHKQGRLFPPEFAVWLGHAAKLDLTELPGLDNLHAPMECILESQKLAASHYGSRRCLYSVNGSSAGIMAAILAAVGQAKLLLAGPFHQSAWRGIVLADALPVFLVSEFDEQRGFQLPPSPAAIRRTLHSHRDIKAVFVTSPTYHGAVADISRIAEICHEFDCALIVDEAHGAHFGLIDDFPKHSVQCGADIVIQSAHKMLPALTQTAWIHVNGNLVSDRVVERWLSTLQTTSPSYLLLASLDTAQAWLRKDGERVAAETMFTLKSVDLLPEDTTRFDPLRHFVPTGDLDESLRLQKQLQQQGIYVEMADSMGVLSLLGFGLKPQDAAVYASVVRGFLQSAGNVKGHSALQCLNSIPAPDMAMRPRDSYGKRAVRVPLDKAEGCIAAEMVTPYPPGVPVIVPGQRIARPNVELLKVLQGMYAEVHGLDSGTVAVLEDLT